MSVNLQLKSYETSIYKTISVVLAILAISLSVWMVVSSSLEEENGHLVPNKQTTSVGKNGESISVIESYTTRSASDILRQETSDAMIIKLQKIIADNKDKLNKGGSAVAYVVGGGISKTTPTEPVIQPDIDPISNIAPCICKDTFRSKYSDKWMSYDIKANKTTTSVVFSYTDSVNVLNYNWYKEDYGFFKRLVNKKYLLTKVTSENPHNTIKNISSWSNESTDEPRTSVGLSVGAQWGFETAKISPYVGVGVNYRLFYIGKRKKR